MWESAIAVIGTLAGGLLVTVTQQVTDRRQQREQHRERVADLTGQLLSAALRYRQLYWLRVDALRAGEPDPVVRADFYQARSDVTEARDRLALVVTDEALLRAASTRPPGPRWTSARSTPAPRRTAGTHRRSRPSSTRRGSGAATHTPSCGRPPPATAPGRPLAVSSTADLRAPDDRSTRRPPA